jgi:hypothetical protein
VVPVPPAPVVPEPVVVKDPKIAELLANATPADKSRVRGIYSGMATVIKRDKGQLIKTTEQLALWQANTLKNAVDPEMKGKYPGLDVAIEAVFDRKILELYPDGDHNPKEVIPADEAVQKKLIEACTLIADSAL